VLFSVAIDNGFEIIVHRHSPLVEIWCDYSMPPSLPSLDGTPVILIGFVAGLVRSAFFSCMSFSKARVAISSIGVISTGVRNLDNSRRRLLVPSILK
jgi:hypothetical protein